MTIGKGISELSKSGELGELFDGIPSRVNENIRRFHSEIRLKTINVRFGESRRVFGFIIKIGFPITYEKEIDLK